MADSQEQKPGEGPLDFSAIDSQAQHSSLSFFERRKGQKESRVLENPRQDAHNEVYRLTVKALRFGAYVICALVLVRVWHLAGPHAIGGMSMRWLTTDEISAIDKMLFSGALGGLVLGHMKEIMKPLDKDGPP